MLKRFVLLLTLIGFFYSVALMATENQAIDVNTADQSQLESIKGLGPKHAKAIIDERQKNGPFKDGEDLKKRVQGIGDKSLNKLQSNGLNIGKTRDKKNKDIGDDQHNKEHKK